MNRFGYHLISGDSLRQPHDATLESKTKTFWFGFWETVFQTNGSTIKPSFENLFRHDYVCVLTLDGEPIGLSCSSLFDMTLKSTRSHPYFAGVFSDSYLAQLNQRKVRSVTTIEYLSVSPDYRRTKASLPIAQTLIGLHVELFKSLELDAIVAVSRSDVKVTQMAEKFGYQTLVTGVQLHNTPCDLIACLRHEAHAHPDPGVRKLVETLWTARDDRSHFSTLGDKNEDQLATGI